MKGFKVVFLCVLILIVTPVLSYGELQLKSIMNDLNNRMKTIVDAINREDFKSIEENALIIADHERPPMEERVKVLGFLKREAPDFKSIDDSIHARAKDLAETAKKKDIEGVVANFGKVQKSCVSCHTRFKSRIVDEFYKTEIN